MPVVSNTANIVPQSGRGDTLKRKRENDDSGSARRSSAACHRCKTKKLKCHYEAVSELNKCAACTKANSDCVFDVPPDGKPRGVAYVVALQARIAALESELHETTMRDNSYIFGGLKATESVEDIGLQAGDTLNTDLSPLLPLRTTRSGSRTEMRSETSRSATEIQAVPSQEPGTTSASKNHNRVTIFNIWGKSTSSSSVDPDIETDLPPPDIGQKFVDKVLNYTQARYSILDWLRLQNWHKRREQLCFTLPDGNVEQHSGAYFIWIVYAIGAQFLSDPQYSCTKYYARALRHLPVVLSAQDIISIQALLALIQYHFRAHEGPSLWQLTGVVMRLCVGLGYHRKFEASGNPPALTLFEVELRKRFFWTAYCFDRLASMFCGRPFSISDLDIDAEVPANIDIVITNDAIIKAAQTGSHSDITTMSSCLHHLRIYRLRSKIITNYIGPYAPTPVYDDFLNSLSQLQEWRDQAPRGKDPSNYPCQSNEHVEAMYLQTVILLMRPFLARDPIDWQVVLHCATLAADACENSKALSLSTHQQISRIQASNAFECGVALLRCLSLKPAILPLRRRLRAINSCCGALMVYTRTLPFASLLMQSFDHLSEQVLYNGDNLDPNLAQLLLRIMSSDPLELPSLLKSIVEAERQRYDEAAIDKSNTDAEAHSVEVSLDPNTLLRGNGQDDTVMPLDMLQDLFSLDCHSQDWTSLWLPS